MVLRLGVVTAQNPACLSFSKFFLITHGGSRWPALPPPPNMPRVASGVHIVKPWRPSTAAKAEQQDPREAKRGILGGPGGADRGSTRTPRENLTKKKMLVGPLPSPPMTALSMCLSTVFVHCSFFCFSCGRPPPTPDGDGNKYLKILCGYRTTSLLELTEPSSAKVCCRTQPATVRTQTKQRQQKALIQRAWFVCKALRDADSET